MNKTLSSITLLILGSAMGIAATLFYVDSQGSNSESNEAAANEPLYWVAPMDANYRRDKPGNSPMGMALVPIFADAASVDDSPGTIRISPDVINNLGVRIAAVKWQAFDSKISTVGYVQYDQDKLIHIHPRVEGWLDKLYIKTTGAQVTKGQALYDIYSPELVSAQEELLLALQRSNKRLIRAAKQRLRALLVPEKTMATLIKTRKVMQNVTIYAPQSGVVGNLAVREGFFVKPGTKIMSIGSLDEVWVNAEVFERQSSLVSVGDKVTMTLGYAPGKEWVGAVDYIYPTLHAKTRTVQLRLRFDNPELALKPNMFTQVNIISESEEGLFIPREAVIRTGDNNRVVLALGEGKFKSIMVTIGRSNAKVIEIIAGLEAGDDVVVSAQFLLDSESSVSSDFKRMSHQEEDREQMVSDAVWVDAVIESAMVEHKMLKVTHQPIEQWDRPVMTMNFMVKQHIDMTPLVAGVAMRMQIVVNEDGGYDIIDIELKPASMKMNMSGDK